VTNGITVRHGSTASPGERGVAPAKRGLRISWSWGAIAVGAPVAAAFLGRTMSVDLAYQLRAGADMLASHRLADVDTFTFTVAGQPWLNQQWGAQVILAGIYKAGGWSGLAVTRGVLLGGVLAFVYLACRAEGASVRTSGLLTLGGWLVGSELLTQLRPQELALVLFALCVWALSTRNEHPGRIWFVPASVLPWVNLHGSFPLALLLLLFAWLEDRRTRPLTARRLVAAMGLAVGACFVNPFGVRVFAYLVDLSSDPVVSKQVAEWDSPSIHSLTGLLFFGSVLAVAGLLARRGRAVPWSRLVELGVFALIGLFAVRGVVWWSIAAPFIVAGVLARSKEPADNVADERSWMNAVIAAAVVILLVVSLPVGRGVDAVSGGPAVVSLAPERLIAAARSAVPSGTRAFVSQVYASWSEFSAPELPVAVDPRIEIFPETVWDDYFVVTTGREGWPSVLDRWNVGVLVLQPGQADGLLAVIGSHAGWHLIIRTDEGSVYVRT